MAQPSPVTFTVAIMDYTTNKTLATQELKFGGTANWTMVNFTDLVPSASTSCVGLSASTDEVDCGKMGPHSHICVSHCSPTHSDHRPCAESATRAHRSGVAGSS